MEGVIHVTIKREQIGTIFKDAQFFCRNVMKDSPYLFISFELFWIKQGHGTYEASLVLIVFLQLLLSCCHVTFHGLKKRLADSFLVKYAFRVTAEGQKHENLPYACIYFVDFNFPILGIVNLFATIPLPFGQTCTCKLS